MRNGMKKRYKKAFKMFVDEIADCSMCPLKSQFAMTKGMCSEEGHCVDVIVSHWLRKADIKHDQRKREVDKHDVLLRHNVL